MRKALAFSWAAAIDLVLDATLGTLWFTLIFTLLVVGVALLPVFGIGIVLLAAGAWLTRISGPVERLRANALLDTSIAPPRRQRVERVGVTRFFAHGIDDLRDTVTWRILLHHFGSTVLGTVAVAVSMTGLMAAFDLALGSGNSVTGGLLEALDGTGPAPRIAIAAAVIVAVGFVVYFAGILDRSLLAPLLGSPRNAELRQEISSLSGKRQAAVDSAAIERQRIERDLHDGAQPRLVAVAMTLGMAKAKLDSDPEAAKALIDQAHNDAKLAITELRQLARGIHPAVLTDRGLDAAVSAVASRCSVPTRVHVALDERPSAEVEAVVYFAIAEALTNVSKHSGATSCEVDIECSDGLLRASVTDNGRGGATQSGDGGLTGIVARVRSAGGTISIDSPTGGPTQLRMELPCAS